MKFTPICEMTKIAKYITENTGKRPEYAHMSISFQWATDNGLILLRLSLDPEKEIFSIEIGVPKSGCIIFACTTKTRYYRDEFHLSAVSILKDILN
jgi:hypothetical protein